VPALKQYCANTRQKKVKGLCKTPWIERHFCLETFGELYEHVVNCLDAMVNPRVYPEVNESHWNWDRFTKATAHGLKSFEVIVGFIVLKNI